MPPPISHGRVSEENLFLAFPISLPFSFMNSAPNWPSDTLKANKHSPSIFFLEKFTLRELAPWPAPDWLTQVSTRPYSHSFNPCCHPGRGLFPQDTWLGPHGHLLCAYSRVGGEARSLLALQSGR